MKKLISLALILLLALSLMLFASAEGTEVSYGVDYSLVTPASEAYPDDGIKLTDGIFGSIPDDGVNYYASGAYVGFNQTSVNSDGDFVVILDLGRVYDDLSGFTVGFLNETSVGIFAPKSVSFSIAHEENGTYTDLGMLNTAKSTADGISETHAATLAAEDVSGRYVRVAIKHLGEYTDANGAIKTAGWTFIDEISVYSSNNANGESGESSDDASDTSSGTDSESEPSLPESSDTSDESDGPVVPGDNGTNMAVFVFLALSAVAMAVALFARRRQSY